MSVTLREKKLNDDRISLYLDIYHNGQRKYEFLNIYLGKEKEVNKENMRVADSIRAKREIEINNNQYGMVPAFKSKTDFVKYFEQIASNKRAWLPPLYQLQNFTKGIRLSAINEQWLKSFQGYLLSKVTRNTAHNYFAYINAALNIAVKEKLIPDNPCKYIEKISKVEIEKSYLTFEEIQKLANADCINSETKRAFLFSCYTGLRISDIEKLTYSEIQGNRLNFRQKKTRQVEYMPLSNMALKILDNQDSKIINLNKNNKVFQLKNHESIRQHLKKWVKNAGIEKPVTFHTARHSFATVALTNGVDIYTVSKLLGHRDLATTQIYAKIVNEKMMDAVNKLPEIDFKNKQA